MPARTHTAVYPGTFDPPTFGHLDVVKRGRRLFDRIVVGVGHNPEKRTVFTIEERAEMLGDEKDSLLALAKKMTVWSSTRCF